MAERPEWWETNEAIRDRLDLPDYEPPRLADGTYTHELVPELERACDCTIRFIGVNTTFPEDWELRVDGRTVRSVERRRDANGNTVYGLTASELCETVRDTVSGPC
jgi:hypothetical protein